MHVAPRLQWELEAPDSAHSPIHVKERLRKSLSFWKEEIQAPLVILDTIRSGYVLPLVSEPTAFSCRNQASALVHVEFMQLQSVHELLVTGCIQEVPTQPHTCSPTSVVVSSAGKKRLVYQSQTLEQVPVETKVSI